MNDLKPGRELDALIAEKVMGLTLETEIGFKFIEDGKEKQSWGNSPEYTRMKCENYKELGLYAELIEQKIAPHYSTDISAAWEVVEKLTEQFSEHEVVVQQDKSSGHKVRWWVTFSGNRMSELGKPLWSVYDSLPMAICLAALKAVENKGAI